MSAPSSGHSHDRFELPILHNVHVETWTTREHRRREGRTEKPQTTLCKAGKGFPVLCRTLLQIGLRFLFVLFILLLKAEAFSRSISNKTCTVSCPVQLRVIVKFLNLILEITTAKNLLSVCHTREVWDRMGCVCYIV